MTLPIFVRQKKNRKKVPPPATPPFLLVLCYVLIDYFYYFTLRNCHDLDAVISLFSGAAENDE